MRVAIGVHPHHAQEYADDPSATRRWRPRTDRATPAARAIGEIGLDYHYDFSPRDVQRAVFRAQVQLARELERPVVVHTREADDDTIAILREEGGGDVRGVLHCFTGDTALAPRGAGPGLLYFAGRHRDVPQGGGAAETVRAVPLDRLLTETDSPFLAPVPYRGKRNEPAHVARVVETLAGLHGSTAGELARRTTANFHALFRP